MTYQEALAWARAQLGHSDTAGLDAQVLLQFVCDIDRSRIISHPETGLTTAEQDRFEKHIAERQHGKPIAHITGEREFWSLRLSVGPHTLIPRPETETLVDGALSLIAKDATCRIADLGTGSGAIALALASERPHCVIVATDLSAAALQAAHANAEALDIHNVEFRCGDWFDALGAERFTLICSNPPYIPEGDPHLLEGDVRFEPTIALIAGPDGLSAIRHIVTQAVKHLEPGGWLILEHGYDQKQATQNLLAAKGYTNIHTVHDLAGLDRVTLAQHA